MSRELSTKVQVLLANKTSERMARYAEVRDRYLTTLREQGRNGVTRPQLQQDETMQVKLLAQLDLLSELSAELAAILPPMLDEHDAVAETETKAEGVSNEHQSTIDERQATKSTSGRRKA